MKKHLPTPPKPTATRADSKEIIRAIVVAGHELASSGIDGVSVRAIAARAGVGTASVHRYFPEKSALFAEIFRHQHALVYGRLMSALRESASLEDGIARAVEGFAGFDEQEAGLRRALNTEMPLDWSLRELLASIDGAMALLDAWLRDHLPDIADAERQRRVFYAMGIVRGVVMLRLLRPERAPERGEMVAFLTDTLIRVATGRDATT